MLKKTNPKQNFVFMNLFVGMYICMYDIFSFYFYLGISKIKLQILNKVPARVPVSKYKSKFKHM